MQADPASTPEHEKKREYIGREFPSRRQFEESVQWLQEEFERHPGRFKNVFSQVRSCSGSA